MTGQETPNTDKPLREDLYKKVMSGDPVAARLPHAIIITKMVTFRGWKRFEMNETMKFHGVTEATCFFLFFMLFFMVHFSKV